MLERSLEEIKSLTTVFEGYQAEVEWDITMRCNYSCSYCESYNNSIPTQFHSLDNYISGLQFLKQYFNNKNARIDILGGEPMLFKQWDEFLNEIHNLDFVPKITTNLSINYKTLLKKLETLLPKQCIDVSWHTQFADDEKILRNINLLYETGHLRAISILGDKRYWSRVLNAYDTVKFTNKAEISFIKDESLGKNKIASKLCNYTEEETTLIKSLKQKHTALYNTEIVYKDGSKDQVNSITDFFSKGITNFQGMKCEVGMNRLHIKPNGDVYPSACLLNYPKAKIGNIFLQKVVKPTKPITCPFSFCGCGPDMRINKYV